MEPARTILIKRRLQGSSGPPNSLKNGELAFNEVDQVLYYGKGDNGQGNANTVIPIAGSFTNILKDSIVETLSSDVVESQDYLILNINGSVRALKLYDF